MKARTVLMTAYACSPSRGSEPGNGWHWAEHVARAGWEVVLLTPTSNRDDLSEAVDRTPNLHVVYVSAPTLTRSRVLPHSAVTYGNYLIWLRAARREGEGLVKSRAIDIVHHTTWGGLFFGSPMWRLGPPFVLGPVGGAQVTPAPLRSSFSISARAREFTRAVSYRLLLNASGAAKTVRSACLVLAASLTVAEVVDRLGSRKTVLMPPDALTSVGFGDRRMHARVDGTDEAITVAWVGRALPIKGLDIAIEAFAQASRDESRLRLRVIGGGPSLLGAQELARQLQLVDRVEFQGQRSFSDTQQLLSESDIFLFSSLRDTFGAQVLEAMGHALPVVALAHHGIGDHCPDGALMKVRAFDSREHAVEQLADHLVRLARDPAARRSLGQRGQKWARSQTWDARATQAIGLYETLLPQGDT